MAFRQSSFKLRLLMLGNGSMKQDIERYIYENGLSGAIHCPGQVPHYRLPDFFRAADFYLSCSYSDGSSISLMEAMASGLPVIVTDSPGNREWVRPGHNGWLAAAGDPKHFGHLIIEAAALAPDKRSAMGILNREAVELCADGDVTGAKLMAFYDRIEQQKKPRRNH